MKHFGIEVDLLAKELPSHVRTVLVEWHPRIVEAKKCTQAARVLLGSGFKLIEGHLGKKQVWLLSRDL